MRPTEVIENPLVNVDIQENSYMDFYVQINT